MGKVVGIDLGTTNSVVAVMEGGKPVVIANAEGMRTTPSVVGFSKDGERLVGQMARRQAVLDPQNTFYAIKRFIGRKYGELVADSKRVPYTIRRDEVGNVRVKCPRLQKDFSPEELSAMILRKLAEEASRYLGEPVTGAVITVPAYFNDSQRQATRDAGRIAGLEVKRILNEPTAASLAYGMERRQNQTVLVFDLGGGTFDVSILEVGDGVFEVKSTSGDTQLGGGDFDKKVVDWLADQFLKQEGIDLRKDRQSLQRLTEAAEKAKIELSGVTTTEINLPFITATEDGPKHLETRLTRSQFEALCGDLISRLRVPVKQALRDAGLSPSQIDEVVLVGGSTRIPAVQDLVYSIIDREPNQNVNPDEVVAIGAAIQAGILTNEVKDILLLDVTPLSVGLETIGGVMKKLIPRNTTIPVRRSDVFSTGEDNQTLVEIHVLQGEREMSAGNKSLGRFKLSGIPPAPRGIPQVQVSFDVDANGILQVTAMDRTTGREQSITIQGASTLSEDEVQRMVREAEEYAEVDRQRKAKVEKRTKAEALTFQAERQLRDAMLDYGSQFVSSHRSRIERAVQQLREALAQNDDRGIDRFQADLQDAVYDLTRDVYQRNKEEEQEESLLGAIKSFFTDDDDNYYYDQRDGNRLGGYGNYGYGGVGYGGLNRNEYRYGNDTYGNRDYNDRWQNDRYDRPANPDRYDQRSRRDQDGQGSPSPRYEDRNWDNRYGDRDDTDSRNRSSRPDPYDRWDNENRPARPSRPDSSRSDLDSREYPPAPRPDTRRTSPTSRQSDEPRLSSSSPREGSSRTPRVSRSENGERSPYDASRRREPEPDRYQPRPDRRSDRTPPRTPRPSAPPDVWDEDDDW